MFRIKNRHLFFTLPSLSFFDGKNFRNNKRIALSPGNFVTTLCEVMKEDWTVVPQTKPASTSIFLFVNSKNKVTGRLKPPLCVPFPRGSMREGGLTRDAIIDFYENHDGTWFLGCTERAVGVAIVNKMGMIDDGSLRSFSLLVQHKNIRASAEYDDPGFIRPGRESPLYGELFQWINERLPHLEQCPNWVARRDDPDNTTWRHLKMVMRDFDQENRFEAHNAAVAEEEAAIGLTAESSNTDPSSAAGEEGSSQLGIRRYSKPADELGDMYGGHGSWTPEGAAAASQFAVERRAILDHPRWIICPPSMMPQRDLMHGRMPNEVNVIGGVGRLRMGAIELL